jgi:hypothetical protein
VLSVLLRFTNSDYPFGIFKLFLPSTNYSQDTYLNYLDILTCYYDTICEDCIAIIGGDLNVDNTKTNPCGKTKTLTDFLETHRISTNRVYERGVQPPHWSGVPRRRP